MSVEIPAEYLEFGQDELAHDIKFFEETMTNPQGLNNLILTLSLAAPDTARTLYDSMAYRVLALSRRLHELQAADG